MRCTDTDGANSRQRYRLLNSLPARSGERPDSAAADDSDVCRVAPEHRPEEVRTWPARFRGLCNWAAGEVDHVVVLFVVNALLVFEAVHELGDPPRASAGPRARAPPIVTAQARREEREEDRAVAGALPWPVG